MVIRVAKSFALTGCRHGGGKHVQENKPSDAPYMYTVAFDVVPCNKQQRATSLKIRRRQPTLQFMHFERNAAIFTAIHNRRKCESRAGRILGAVAASVAIPAVCNSIFILSARLSR